MHSWEPLRRDGLCNRIEGVARIVVVDVGVGAQARFMQAAAKQLYASRMSDQVRCATPANVHQRHEFRMVFSFCALRKESPTDLSCVCVKAALEAELEAQRKAIAATLVPNGSPMGWLLADWTATYSANLCVAFVQPWCTRRGAHLAALGRPRQCVNASNASAAAFLMRVSIDARVVEVCGALAAGQCEGGGTAARCLCGRLWGRGPAAPSTRRTFGCATRRNARASCGGGACAAWIVASGGCHYAISRARGANVT